MQGTIVMLMALSGLGCHHKSCDVAYVPSCYSGGCYGGCYGGEYETIVQPSCYSACYATSYSGCYSGCYGGAWNSCYSSWDSCYSSCYSPRRGCGLFRGLFACFTGRPWGAFGRHHRYYDAYCDFPVDTGCYATAYADYSPAVFGSSMPIYETPRTTGQGGAPATEAPATPPPAPAETKPAAPKPAAPKPEETSAPTPPPPPPSAVPPSPVTPPAPAAPTPKPPTPAEAVENLVKPKT